MIRMYPDLIEEDDPTSLFNKGRGSSLYIVLSWSMYRDLNVHRDYEDGFMLKTIGHHYKTSWPTTG